MALSANQKRVCSQRANQCRAQGRISEKHQFEKSFVLTSDILKIEKKSSQALIEIL